MIPEPTIHRDVEVFANEGDTLRDYLRSIGKGFNPVQESLARAWREATASGDPEQVDKVKELMGHSDMALTAIDRLFDALGVTWVAPEPDPEEPF